MEAVDKALYILDTTRRVGCITTSILSTTPGWNRVSAHRFLSHLSQRGWLERLTEAAMGKQAKYVLGRKALEMGGDLRI